MILILIADTRIVVKQRRIDTGARDVGDIMVVLVVVVDSSTSSGVVDVVATTK